MNSYLVIGLGVIVLAVISIVVLMKKPSSETQTNSSQKENTNKAIKKLKLNDDANESNVIDYNQYYMKAPEKLKYILFSAIGIFAVGYLFYRSIIFSALLSALSLLAPAFFKQLKIRKQKKELLMQFKEGIYALSSSLGAGKSILRAFSEAAEDLKILYPSKDAYIINEFQLIVRRLRMNETPEDCLLDFAKRAHVEDISSFVDIFVTANRRDSSKVNEIIRNTSKIIGDKLDIEREIETLIAEKQIEQRVMNAVPVFLIIFLSVSSGDYMEPLFTTILGRIAMTVALLIFIAAFFISQKITDIEV